MKLSGKQREEFQNAMVSAFPKTISLEMMLKNKLSKNIEVIAKGNDQKEIIFKLINRAESEGWLQELVNKAHEHNPGNPELKLFVQSFKEENARPDIPGPYRGLSAFGEEDTDLFFGREEFVQQLVNAVKQHPLVPVIGASGSGKSSVVLAGLIPRLRAEGTWLIGSFRPQSQPFYGLASALVRVRYPELNKNKNKRDEQISNLFERMQGNRKLWQEITDILKTNPGKRLLLVIDQFEELYAFNTKEQQKLVTKEQQKFVDALLEAIKENPRLKLVLTIRTDFLDYIINYPSFKEVALKQDTPQYLGQMNEQEIKSVIELTDDHRTENIVRLEDGLTDTILNDVKQEPGNLPLLEFALTQLWEENQGGILTHQAYQKIGGVRKALANHADAIYHNLDEKEKKQLQQIFVRLARLGEKRDIAEEEKRQTQQSFVATDTRQLATRSEIGTDNWSLVQKLAAAVDPDIPNNEKKLRLLVTGRDDKTGEPTVEVVHEALIREWERLQKWIDDDRTFLTWQNRLRISIAEWNKGEGELLQDKALVIAEDWLQKREADLTDEQQKYIRQSLARREKEIEDIKERESQKQQSALIRITAIYSGIVILILIVLLNRQSIITVLIIANKQHLAESRWLEKMYLPKADLSGANLWNAHVSEADLTEANLLGAQLQSAYLLKTYLPRANLSHANLSQANLSEAYMDRADLSGANLEGARLLKTYMTKAKLLKAYLSQANLSEANIDGADLSGANLQGAELVKTFMPGSHLQDADLSQANLLEANIDGANLSGANLQGAKNLNPDQVKRAKNWDQAKYDEDFRKKLNLKGSIRKKLNLKGSNCNCPIVPIAPLDETSK